MIKKTRGYLTWRSEPASDATLHLERDGYTVVRNAFDPVAVAAMREDIERVFTEYPPDARNPNPQAQEMFRYEMLNRSRLCQDAIGHRAILDTVEPLLGEDCHVIANTAWRNPPNRTGVHGGERWHIDAGPHIPLPPDVKWPANMPHPVFAIGVHIYLQACALEDGPTGVIAGSHLSGRTPPRDHLLDDDLAWDGVRATPLLAEPGDVAFFVSDVWHRRMSTQPGDRGRFFLQVHYGRRDIAQRLHTTDTTNQLAAETIAHAADERARTVIGLHPPLFYDG